jgi:hypothetical protein
MNFISAKNVALLVAAGLLASTGTAVAAGTATPAPTATTRRTHQIQLLRHIALAIKLPMMH